MSIYLEDPFTGIHTSVPSPTPPQPCLLPPSARRSSRHSTNAVERGRDCQQQRQFGSMSSTADSTLTTPISTIDIEKAFLTKKNAPHRHNKKAKRQKRSGEDRISEKPMDNRVTGVHSSTNSHNSSIVLYEEEVDDGRQIQERKAMRILLFLSGPCVLLSSLNAAWACVALVVTLLSQPIRLCAKRPTFGQQLAGLLGPSLNLQLRSIYTPLPPHANEDASYNSFLLIAEHLMSLFLSFVMMFAAWTLAVYWLSSAVVGDPAGQDKRDDGKEAVLGLRRWWERWLTKSAKNEQW